MAGLFLAVGAGAGAELAVMGGTHCLEPILFERLQRQFSLIRRHPPLTEFTPDADRAIAPVGPLGRVLFGETCVAEQPAPGQVIEDLTQCLGGVLAGQLAFQLGPAVFPDRQQADRCLLYFAVQAGASSTWGSFSRAMGSLSGVTAVRILASISAAMALFSLRYWRTFSLP